MPIKTYRPITPSLRTTSTLVNDDLTASRPHKPLTVKRLRTGGRRNVGDLTIVECIQGGIYACLPVFL
jgi:large subunit ribosomal protein L2